MSLLCVYLDELSLWERNATVSKQVRCKVKYRGFLSNVLFVYIYYYIMQYGPEGELTLKQKSHILKADHIASKNVMHMFSQIACIIFYD